MKWLFRQLRLFYPPQVFRLLCPKWLRAARRYVTKHLSTVLLLLAMPLVYVPLAGLDNAFAADETLVFSAPEKKQLYQKLTREMRCLKCQNQNLAGSPAGLAEDLKREIFLMVEDGKSAAHITDFMVSRYGDFILYKPAIKPLTLVLWAAPFLLMAAGLLVIVRLTKTGTAVNDGVTSEQAQTQFPATKTAAGDSDALLQARSLLNADAVEADSSANTHTSR